MRVRGGAEDEGERRVVLWRGVRGVSERSG